MRLIVVVVVVGVVVGVVVTISLTTSAGLLEDDNSIDGNIFTTGLVIMTLIQGVNVKNVNHLQ